MRSFSPFVLVLCVCSAVTRRVSAESFVFTPEDGRPSISFVINGPPTVSYTLADPYLLDIADYTLANGFTQKFWGADEAPLYYIYGYGQFDAEFQGLYGIYVLDGPQLFAGTTADPQFLAGSYSLVGDPKFNGTGGTLVIAGSGASTTPEPPSILLLASGLIGAAFLFRGHALRRSESL